MATKKIAKTVDMGGSKMSSEDGMNANAAATAETLRKAGFDLGKKPESSRLGYRLDFDYLRLTYLL